MKLYIAEIRKPRYSKLGVWVPVELPQKANCAEIRKPRYSKLGIWVPVELPRKANCSWEFSSNKARLAAQLISSHTSLKLYFDRGLIVEADAGEELVETLDRLWRIKRNFTQPIFKKLSGATGSLERFNEELEPFIDEQILKDNLEAK